MPHLAPKNACVGCTACVAVCPKHCLEMYKDCDGFSYPRTVLPSNCSDCRLCESVCPILHRPPNTNLQVSAYAAFSKKGELRESSSSGGMFSELALKIIAAGGVVYGAIYSDDFTVEYCRADDESGLSRLRGAKYAEAELGNTFSDVKRCLDSGRTVMFCGTPCRVAALRTFLRRDYDKLYCVDFVCHSIPSPMAWEKYVKYRAKTDNDGTLPCRINIRSKETGWSRFSYSSVFEYGNGKKYAKSGLDDMFIKLFLSGNISRESCSECRFKGYSRVSDITLGDFWGIWDIAPDMDDNRGTSVVLVHSEKGKCLLSELDGVEIREMTLEQASVKNAAMIARNSSSAFRRTVLRRIRHGKIDSCEKYCNRAPSLAHRALCKLRRIFLRYGEIK